MFPRSRQEGRNAAFAARAFPFVSGCVLPGKGVRAHSRRHHPLPSRLRTLHTWTRTGHTGGRSFFPPIYKEQEKEVRDLDEIYRRIAAEVRAQYVLTYYSNTESRDRKFRSIRVELKKAGLQVRARRGYYSDKTQ